MSQVIKNYGNKYEGEISLKKAFAKSSNVVAVKISEKIYDMWWTHIDGIWLVLALHYLNCLYGQ